MVVHTTTNHPWLTADHGWLPAGFLHVGEPVATLGGGDGANATVEAVRVVPGAARMWDLTVANVHTFAVGTSQAVVHNCGGSYNSLDELAGALDKDKPVTIIGETMKRVGRLKADLEGAGFKVNTWDTDFDALKDPMEVNRSWLRYWTKAKSAQIVDIGTDAARTRRSVY